MRKTHYFLLLISVICFSSCDNNANSESKGIKDCLVGYDWCQPNCSNPSMAWKFFSDKTFNYSTSIFGGMSAWGTWKDIGKNKVELVYTKTSTGDALPKKILSMPDCSSLLVGTTLYKR